MLAVVRRLEAVLALSLVAGMAGGCGGAYTTYDTHETFVASTPEVQLVRIEQQIDGQAEVMSLSEPLYSGDKTALVLQVPEPLFVYVVNIAPDGTRQVIWPSGAPRAITGLQRIPSDDGWFTLTGEAGQEVVAVVATRDRQSLDGAGGRRLVSAVERASAQRLTRVQSALPPGILEAGHATMGIRGTNLTFHDGRVSVASSDPLVMIFDIDHRAADDR